jgi:diguanylate cyclase (GGDEF)-like protein/PAS domain S-box-containing protein
MHQWTADFRLMHEPQTPRAGEVERPDYRLPDGGLPLLFQQHPMPMWLLEPAAGRILDVNQAALLAYGYSREEFLGRNAASLVHPDDAARHAAEQAAAADLPLAGPRRSSGWRHLRRDGSLLRVDLHHQDFSQDERPLSLVMAYDISTLHQLVDKADEQSAHFRQLFLGSPDAIALLDRNDLVVDVNPAFERLFQFSREEALRRPINGLVVPAEREAEGAALSALAFAGGIEPVETVRRRKDGSEVHVSTFSYPVLLNGEVAGAYAIYQDRSRTRRLLSELSYRASHDRVTGLLNRGEFERLAAERLAEAGPGHRGFALLHLELDQFKLINDSYGSDVGDKLLRETGELLRQKTRNLGLLARIGTTEFAILLCDLGAEMAEQFAQRLMRDAEASRFDFGGHPGPLQINAGLMHRPRGSATGIGDLVGGAAMACHIAADKGRGHVEIFRADDQGVRRHRDEVAWGTRIADSITQNRLILYLQRIAPVAAPDLGRRYEVLLRVLDQDGGVMPPGMLIAAAERLRMMPMVDRYVIDMALAELARAREQGSELPESLSINLSGLSLGQHSLASFIYDKILQYGVMPGMLCFEITETAAIRNLDIAAEFVQDMRNLGCGVALDDFGTGMSSFAYLRSLDIDYLKIDGQFIRELLGNPFDSATVESVSKLARIKGCRTVAECVENEETLLRLRELGVDLVQGFHLHRPEPWAVGNLPRPPQRLLERRAA